MIETETNSKKCVVYILSVNDRMKCRKGERKGVSSPASASGDRLEAAGAAGHVAAVGCEEAGTGTGILHLLLIRLRHQNHPAHGYPLPPSRHGEIRPPRPPAFV